MQQYHLSLTPVTIGAPVELLVQTVRVGFWYGFKVSNLLIWNGLQSVRWPSKDAKNNARIIIFQSILCLMNSI